MSFRIMFQNCSIVVAVHFNIFTHNFDIQVSNYSKRVFILQVLCTFSTINISIHQLNGIQWTLVLSSQQLPNSIFPHFQNPPYTWYQLLDLRRWQKIKSWKFSQTFPMHLWGYVKNFVEFGWSGPEWWNFLHRQSLFLHVPVNYNKLWSENLLSL